MTITAAADGSALGNPGPAGWAWYVDDDCWAAGGWPRATNNQGELTAVLELFGATAHLDDDLVIMCDSQYVINSVTKWMRGWKAKGWRKSDGKPVMNLDLLQQLDAALVGRRYRFEWVKGHIGHVLNEAADIRARGAAEAYQRGRDVPRGPGWMRGGVQAPVSAVASTRFAPGASAAAQPLSLFDL
jgi:ribonuclease HI